MDNVVFTLSDIMPYVESVSNIVAFGIGIILGGFVFGGFIYGLNSNE